jgi:uncharacterized protein YecT (DUF1311 family)
MTARFHWPFTAASICALALSFAAQPCQAQSRKPTAKEFASIQHCVTRNADDLDEGERQCLFKLVAEPCIGKPLGAAADAIVADCYRIENSIWDGLLNDNYKSLLETLDDDQTAKARAMQRAWVACRDTTCHFYDDKIQGTMSITMHAACEARESARRAMLLKFFSRL